MPEYTKVNRGEIGRTLRSAARGYRERIVKHDGEVDRKAVATYHGLNGEGKGKDYRN